MFAYGVGVNSDLPLPDLAPTHGPADIDVRLGSVRCSAPVPRGKALSLSVSSEGVFLRLAGVGTVLVRDGREIVVEPGPGADPHMLRLLVLGPALAVLLHQRGRLVLHASAVADDRGAVGFLGGAGSGKSTIAAALHTRGFRFFADDVVPVELPGSGPPTVWPGFPQMKLWPAAAAAVGCDVESLPRLHPRFEKRSRPATAGSPHDALPLRRIYVLAPGAAPAIEPLERREALVELLRNLYCVRTIRATRDSAHLVQCASLINIVPILRLSRSSAIAGLADLARLVQEDLSNGA